VRSREPEDELLGGEVTRVAGLRRLDVAGEGDRQRPSERGADPRPRLERRRRALATLDLRVPRPADPDLVGNLLLGASSTSAASP